MLGQSLTAITAIPIIVALVEGAKRAGLVNGSTAFLLALGLGVLTGIGLLVQGGDYSGPAIVATMVAGIGAGLAASGAYSGVATFRAQPQDTASTPTPSPDVVVGTPAEHAVEGQKSTPGAAQGG